MAEIKKNCEEAVKTADMTHEEWITYRRKGIGGSDVGAICGLSKWKSPYAIYLAKIDELPYEPQSDAAHFGDVLEEIVAKEFTKVTGKRVRRKNAMLRHKEYNFMLANIDRDVVGERAFLECKTTSAYNHKEWEDDKIPETYMLQIQHYMAVLDYDYCYIACLIGGNNFVWKKIERDNELIETMINIEKDFWENNVLKKVPPAVDGGGNDKELLNLLYPNAEKKEEMFLSYECAEKLNEIRELKEKKEELEEEITNRENFIKNELREYECGSVDDIEVSWKVINSARVNTKKLKELYPEIYEECVNQSSYRKFAIKYPKAD